MFEMKIDFPKKITSEIVGYETLIAFYEKMSTIYDSDITIDFRNNYWFEANLCAIFGAMVEELENRGNIIKLVNIKQPKDILSKKMGMKLEERSQGMVSPVISVGGGRENSLKR